MIGSGTILDTARFRYLLGRHYGVDPRSVHAFIIGEHGDSEVPVWSSANIAGMPLEAFCQAHGLSCSRADLDAIFQATREAAYHVIERKGATYYGIAAGLTRIVQAVLRDERSVLSVSTVLQGEYGLDDVCLSLPSIVGRGGVEQRLQLALNPEETAGLRRSADVLRQNQTQLR